MHIHTKFLTLIACGVALTAAAFSVDIQNNQTRPGPGGAYGVYQVIISSPDRPDQVSSYVCSGGVAVRVPTIESRIKDPKITGLRELWGLTNYHTNSLPDAWLPDKPPPQKQDVEAFKQFTPGSDGFVIRRFIEQFGLPGRYLTGQWQDKQVYRFERGEPQHDSSHLLQGPDFLIYDLPSGHAVALYVPKPPADNFSTAIIIDVKGELLIPNMVEILLPVLPKVAPSRKLIAESNGRLTTPNASGGKEIIGTWVTKDSELIITTILKSSEAVASQDTIWLDDKEYVTIIRNNEHKIICLPVRDRSATPRREK